MTDKSREAFEACIARTHPLLPLTRFDIDGSYVAGVASDCWLIWQACIAVAEHYKVSVGNSSAGEIA